MLLAERTQKLILTIELCVLIVAEQELGAIALDTEIHLLKMMVHFAFRFVGIFIALILVQNASTASLRPIGSFSTYNAGTEATSTLTDCDATSVNRIKAESTTASQIVKDAVALIQNIGLDKMDTSNDHRARLYQKFFKPGSASQVLSTLQKANPIGKFQFTGPRVGVHCGNTWIEEKNRRSVGKPSTLCSDNTNGITILLSSQWVNDKRYPQSEYQIVASEPSAFTQGEHIVLCPRWFNTLQSSPGAAKVGVSADTQTTTRARTLIHELTHAVDSTILDKGGYVFSAISGTRSSDSGDPLKNAQSFAMWAQLVSSVDGCSSFDWTSGRAATPASGT
ncbi:hypothetical protein F5884DRAFT_810100 [Xylogone sp. PMI_703]|nr:hypothetical protein F5884DRAFT_810100 [Xylogone sp. PMI_703]